MLKMASIERKIAIHALMKHSLVEEVHENCYFISIKFTTGIWENWMTTSGSGHTVGVKAHHQKRPFRFPFPARPPYYTARKLRNHREFESSPFDDDYNVRSKLFILEYKRYRKARFIDQRLMVHALIKNLMEEGWVDPVYPKSSITSDWKDTKDGDVSCHLRGGELYLYGSKFPGRHIIESYLPYGTHVSQGRSSLVDAWTPANLHRVIRVLLDKRKDVTRHNIVKKLNVSRFSLAGPRFISVGCYRIMFQKLQLAPKVISDWRPDFGGKMLLAAAIGADYYADQAWVDVAKDNGIEDLLGIKIGREPVRSSVDLLMMDGLDVFMKPKKIRTPTVAYSPKPLGHKYVRVNPFPVLHKPIYFCLLEK